MNVIFGISIKNCIGEHRIAEKKIFARIRSLGDPRRKKKKKQQRGSTGADFDKNVFLANLMFVDTVFDADSEYDIHSPWT